MHYIINVLEQQTWIPNLIQLQVAHIKRKHELNLTHMITGLWLLESYSA